MKNLLLILILAIGLSATAEFRMSDMFVNETETYENWVVTKTVSEEAEETDGVVNDSLDIKITSLDGDNITTSVVFGKPGLTLEILKKIEKIEFDVHFKTGFPLYGASSIGKTRYFEMFGLIQIIQSYNDYWSAHGEFYNPGYYICDRGYPLYPDGYINDNSPLDFEIELRLIDNTGIVPLYTCTITAYKNGYEILQLTDIQVYLDEFKISSLISSSRAIDSQTYRDDEAEHEIKIDKIIVYPDYSAVELTKTNSIWGYTESEQTVNVAMEDSYTGEKCIGSDVEITTGEGKVYQGITDENGEVSFTGITTANENDLELNASKGEFYNYKGTIDVQYYEFDVSHQSEIPVLKSVVNTIIVSKPDAIEGTLPIAGALVELTNGDDYIYSGITNLHGIYDVGTYLSNNKKIGIKVTKDRYKTYTGNIYPYLWSNVPEAFGTNNQEHIVRKPNTDEMRMVYTTGNSIIFAKSSDFGATWELEVLGEGDKPTMIQTADGYLSAWVENNCDLVYTLSQSPWIPIDTLNPDLYWVSEPTLGYTAVNDKSYLGYIGNNQLIGESGSYVLASMTNLDPATLTFDTVVSYLGDVNNPLIVPMKSPIFSLYAQSTGIVSHLIGFIDTSSKYIIKSCNSLPPFNWLTTQLVSNSGQICNSPTTDYYGQATTFAYEVINLDGTRDIWEAKMTDGVMEAPAKTNSFVGVNKNPKVKNNYLTAYVNNDNKVISEPGYGLTYQQNVVASTEDSIFSYDVNLKETYTSKKGLFVWTEGSNGTYKLNMKQVSYKPEPVPYIASEPTDTITTVTVSPLYDYIGKKEPVEQLNTTINGLNPEMNYTVKVITSEGSPVKPQIIQIDGEVYAVVIGHANRPDTTEITLPTETYQDYSVVVSIDRKRGNPNRDAEVLVYQYETDGDEVVAVSNKIKMLTPVNTDTETTAKNLFTTKEEAYISYTTTESKEIEVIVYDITGSKLKSVKKQVKAGANNIKLSGLKKSGVYFIQICNEGAIQTKRINIIK